MGSFHYGTAGGLTPDVTVEYLGAPGNSQQDVNFWQTGYSDLVNVIEYEPDGQASYGVQFSASNGQAVTLTSFDLGNWGGAVTLAALTVRNAAGGILWQQTNISVPDSSQPHLSFAPNVTGTTLLLTVDLGGLGSESDNIGLDNLQFSQSPVPEPGTMAALGCGVAAMLRRRKKTSGRS